MNHRPLDSATIAAAADGEAPAWRRIYDEAAGPVLGYLQAHGAPEAEELLSEVFDHLARRIGDFSGSPSGFRSWVLRVAHPRLVDERRYWSRRPLEATGDVADLQGVERPVTPVADLVARLDVEQRDVLLLRLVGGLTVAETAAAMGKGVRAVRALQGSALAGLAAMVGGRPEAAGRVGRRGGTPFSRRVAEAALTGGATGDAAVDAVLADLAGRAESEPPEWMADRAVAAAVAASVADPFAPVQVPYVAAGAPPRSIRLPVARVVIVLASLVAATGIAAANELLPDPVQAAVADAASVFGIELPDPDDRADTEDGLGPEAVDRGGEAGGAPDRFPEVTGEGEPPPPGHGDGGAVSGDGADDDSPTDVAGNARGGAVARPRSPHGDRDRGAWGDDGDDDEGPATDDAGDDEDGEHDAATTEDDEEDGDEAGDDESGNGDDEDDDEGNGDDEDDDDQDAEDDAGDQDGDVEPDEEDSDDRDDDEVGDDEAGEASGGGDIAPDEEDAAMLPALPDAIATQPGTGDDGEDDEHADVVDDAEDGDGHGASGGGERDD